MNSSSPRNSDINATIDEIDLHAALKTLTTTVKKYEHPGFTLRKNSAYLKHIRNLANHLTALNRKAFLQLVALTDTHEGEGIHPSHLRIANIHSNLSLLIKQNIITAKNSEARAVVIKRWLLVAEISLENNDYAAVQPIIEVVDSMVIQLRATKRKLQKEQQEYLMKITALNLGSESALKKYKDETVTLIPFFGLYRSKFIHLKNHFQEQEKRIRFLEYFYLFLKQTDAYSTEDATPFNLQECMENCMREYLEMQFAFFENMGRTLEEKKLPLRWLNMRKKKKIKKIYLRPVVAKVCFQNNPPIYHYPWTLVRKSHQNLLALKKILKIHLLLSSRSPSYLSFRTQ